jgi:deazaflavin-dependent oxidoreductase (nitroreductase family)
MRIDAVLSRVTMVLPDAFVRSYGKAHGHVFRATKGRVGRYWARRPVLLLTTTGRRSGEPRSTMVLYGRDGGRLVVIGSNTGSDNAPAWALNLAANPEAEVMVSGSVVRVRATEVDGPDRDRVWRLMTEQYAGFDMYRARTSRGIKVFSLEPA